MKGFSYKILNVQAFDVQGVDDVLDIHKYLMKKNNMI